MRRDTMPRPYSVTPIVVAGLLAAMGLHAQSISPEPMPDLAIRGARFPESEVTLTRWFTDMTRAPSEDARSAAANQIYLHAWSLWAGLTADANQVYGGQRLRVFETWATPDDLGQPVVVDDTPARRTAALRRPTSA